MINSKKQFKELRDLKENQLHRQLEKALKDIEENAFCGIQIPKKLILKEYIKRFGHLSNLWKYNLPDAWRLIYTIKTNQVEILSIILDWMNHKTYERRFKY